MFAGEIFGLGWNIWFRLVSKTIFKGRWISEIFLIEFQKNLNSKFPNL